MTVIKSGIDKATQGMADKLAERRRQRDEARENAPLATTDAGPGVATPSPAPPPPKSGTGAIFARQEQGLLQQLEDLKQRLAESQAAGVGSLIPTGKIRPSRFHNRFEADLDPVLDPDFAELVASIAETGGNKVPALVLRIEGEDAYELVWGHRRWKACELGEFDLLAQVEETMDPRVIAHLQLVENANRKNPSVLDMAKQMASQLEQKAWESQAELAAIVGKSEGWVSQRLEIARLDPILQICHPNHHLLTGKQLLKICKLAKRQPAAYKQRLQVVSSRKQEWSSQKATHYILNGEEAKKAPGPGLAQLQTSKRGLTLRVREMPSPVKAAKFQEALNKLLKEFGLLPADSATEATQ